MPCLNPAKWVRRTALHHNWSDGVPDRYGVNSEPDRMTRRILFDVTELLALRLNTGVQRVVRELYRALAQRADIELVPVIALDGRFVAVTDAAAALVLSDPLPTKAAMPPQRGAARRLAERVLSHVPPLFALAQQRYFKRRMPQMLLPFRQHGSVAISPNDFVVAADTFWTGSDVVAALTKARRSGATITALIYDMIPYTHPELAGAGLARSFPRLLRQIARQAHRVVTISHFSAAEIERFLKRHRIERPVGVFYLGSDLQLGGTAQATGGWPPGLWTSDARTVLTVGTIEPRKGHDTMLAAFDARWKAGSSDRLLIVGRRGAGDGAAALHLALDTHVERGRRLFVLHDVDDAMLADAYARADLGIMASRIEGFGLPLIEALSRGLPMVASDIAVFQELAGSHAAYFAVGDPDSLNRALDATGVHPERIAGFDWPDWTTAASLFLDALSPPNAAGH